MLSRSSGPHGNRRRSERGNRRGLVTWALAALLVAAGGTAIACSDSVVDPISAPTALAAQQVKAFGPLNAANAGAYHNAFLDFSFPKVKKAISKGADHRQACKVIAQAMREFIVAYRLEADPREVGDDIAGARCASAGGKGPRFALGTDGTPSPELEAVTNEMAYAVEAGLSAAELSPLFEQKVAYARANLDAAEAEVVAAAASVGLSSVGYWDTNYEPQLEQLKAGSDGEAAYNNTPVHAAGELWPADALIIPETPRFWRAGAARVAVADLKGAVHGGISGARGGLQGVLIGAAIEGGAKSAGALIAELFR